MTRSTTATARFAKVVETAGIPEVVSLWTKADRDKVFMKAVRENRVMTIKEERVGAAKDYGVVGFVREKNVSYLIFPKPLEEFRQHRIIGIKYDLIATPGPVGRVIRPEIAPKRGGCGKTEPAEWKPEGQARETSSERAKKFKVTVRFRATAESHETVQAPSSKEAKELGLQQAIMPDFRRGTVTRKVVKIMAD